MAYPVDGIVLIDKEPEITSHDVVQKVRFALNTKKGYRVGHAGTLDPFATGLLIILLGQATRLFDYLVAGEKMYEAVMTLGVETDTLDGAGRVVSTTPVPDFPTSHIRQEAMALVGEIEQVPPVYSAIKIDGKRAYALARNGVAVPMKSRRVKVSALDILGVDLPRLSLRVRCSSGTYIRSLAADLGRILGPGGHLSALRRIQSGGFHVDDALGSEEISREQGEILGQRTLSLREALPGIQEVQVDGELARKVRHGYQPSADDLLRSSHSTRAEPGCDAEYTPERSIKLIHQEKLIAVLTVNHGGGGRYERVSIDKVFS